jgi:DUF917 family protein
LAARRAKRSRRGADPVAALVRVTNGFQLFQGTVAKATGNGDRGFTWWDVELKGTGPFAGHTYRVWVKNENNLTWLVPRLRSHVN